MLLKLLSLAIGVLLVLCLGVYLIWQSIPLLLAGVVKLVPVSFEDQLGKAVVAGIVREGKLCDDAGARELVDKVVARLEAAMPKSPYKFEVQVVQNPQVNALAAPGGHIVVFSGLIAKMENPEQLAAVLAHEMQHVVQRHSMKSLVRSVGLQAVLSLVVGDPGVLGGLAGNLTVLHFMRSDEERADDGALDTLLEAGIDPVQMQKAFENLAKASEGGADFDPLKYLSTHPPLKERILRVQSRAGAIRAAWRPIGVAMSRGCLAGR